MLIGVPKEIKNNEFRVGLVPNSVAELVHAGHKVTVEAGAGLGAGCSDADYVSAGATIEKNVEKIFAKADMIVKVKEPQAVERARLKKGQILFTYLHLAPELAQNHIGRFAPVVSEPRMNQGIHAIVRQVVSPINIATLL